MQPGGNSRTILQCDFDGTVTTHDVAFFLLDRFAGGDWREVLKEYREDRITVGEFNRRAFAMVKANRDEMVDYVREMAVLREGLPELVTACAKLGLRFIIVSNGLDFYIETILGDIGLKGVEFHAAETVFDPEGLKVRYVSPCGCEIDDGFKESYIRSFLKEGYRTIYVGNGSSDFAPASLAHRIYAIESLLEHCNKASLSCQTFRDLKDIAENLRMYHGNS